MILSIWIDRLTFLVNLAEPDRKKLDYYPFSVKWVNEAFSSESSLQSEL